MEEFHSSTEVVYNRRRKSRDRRCLIVVLVVVGIAAFIIGILIGRYATCPDKETDDRDGVFLEGVPEKLMEDEDPGVSEVLIQGMSADNIRENLRYVQNFAIVLILTCFEVAYHNNTS